jgi:hypothetical protein
MKIEFYYPRWGSEGLSLEHLLKTIKKSGYDGIETGMLPSHDQKLLSKLLDKYQLKLILQHWETHEADFELHREKYLTHIRKLVALKPEFINSHTGKDYFTFEQNMQLLERAQEISEQSGVKITHETHRGRFSFAAHVTANFIKSLQSLQLTLDISHWFCVAESYLEDQQETLTLAINRTAHIHSRVGCTQGPQVIDPASVFYQDALNQHLKIWDGIIKKLRANGATILPVTTEFGPPPYLWVSPKSGKPLASQKGNNLFIKNLFIERYS